MSTPGPFHQNLRLKIAAVLGTSPSRDDLNGLITICHALATAFVQSKRSSRPLIDRQGYTASDLGFDCIADLFQQDDHGDFIQLKMYFEGLPPGQTDAAILTHVRRLVFSKVNHRIFRIYNELDPGLGKILRNIKIAVHMLRGFTEVERYGESYLVPGLCDTLEHLPALETELLLHELLAEAPPRSRVPELLACLSRFLRRQNSCSRLIPLLDTAIIIRDWYAADSRDQEEGSTSETALAADDTLQIIRHSCRAVFQAMRATYVGKKKMCPELFETCCAVVEEGVIERLVAGNDGQRSFFHRMRDRLPELTEEEYRSVHRTRLEYLARKAYRQAVGELRKEI